MRKYILAALIVLFLTARSYAYVMTSTVIDIGHSQTPTAKSLFIDGVTGNSGKITFAAVSTVAGKHGVYTLSNYTANVHDYHLVVKRPDGTFFYAKDSKGGSLLTDYDAAKTALSTTDARLSHLDADISSIVYSGGGVGLGNTAVTSNFGGPCALCIKNSFGAGIGGATVTAYLKTDYAAGRVTPTYAKGTVITNDAGEWGPIMLNHGTTYILVISKGAVIKVKIVEVTP